MYQDKGIVLVLAEHDDKAMSAEDAETLVAKVCNVHVCTFCPIC